MNKLDAAELLIRREHSLPGNWRAFAFESLDVAGGGEVWTLTGGLVHRHFTRGPRKGKPDFSHARANPTTYAIAKATVERFMEGE